MARWQVAGAAPVVNQTTKNETRRADEPGECSKHATGIRASGAVGLLAPGMLILLTRARAHRGARRALGGWRTTTAGMIQDGGTAKTPLPPTRLLGTAKT